MTVLARKTSLKSIRLLSLFVIACALMFSACGEKPATNEVSSSVSLVSEAQKEALVKRLQEIDASVLSGDPVEMREAMAPDDYKRALGEAMGITESQMGVFMSQMDDTMDQLFEVSSFERHVIFTDKVEYMSGSDGKPVAKVPFEMDMTVYGQAFEVEGHYFAVIRNQNWLVLSPSDATAVTLLKSAFSELEDLDLSENSMTLVD